jgi:hypothetical protein
MTDSSGTGAEVVRRLVTARPGRPASPDEMPDSLRPVAGGGVGEVDRGRPAVAPAAARLDPRQLEDVVDQVVDRIEQRVIDELERRGRFGAVGGM